MSLNHRAQTVIPVTVQLDLEDSPRSAHFVRALTDAEGATLRGAREGVSVLHAEIRRLSLQEARALCARMLPFAAKPKFKRLGKEKEPVYVFRPSPRRMECHLTADGLEKTAEAMLLLARTLRSRS